jgi:two-component system response regulator HydG
MQPVEVMVVSDGASDGNLRRTLRGLGFHGVGPERAEHAIAIVADPEASRRSVEALCRDLARDYPGVPVIIVGNGQMQSALNALHAGAADYVDGGAMADLGPALDRARYDRAIRGRRRCDVQPPHEGDLHGASVAVSQLREEVARAAASEVTVIVVGESGTGKELVARLLHAGGPRSGSRFVAVDCASIPNQLAESELFGYVKGAFSGALTSHPGLMRAADGGTLFLDDIGSLTPELQAKLLRSLQQRSVRAVGSDEEVPTDFRLIVSSQVPAEELVRDGRLRADLYYRLAVLEIRIPPLRSRDLDVLTLAEGFYETAAGRSGKKVVGMTPAFQEALLRYAWPGNIRELRNAIDYAVAVARFDHLGAADLPRSIRPAAVATTPQKPDAKWEAAERIHIEDVIRRTGGNRSLAAELLGIDRKTLQRKLERFGINVPPRSGSGVREKVDVTESAPHSSRYRFNFR